MWIDYIELENYRQWKDARIEFNNPKENNVTVIKGDMGAGKTNLLNAITWCLYQDEKYLDTDYDMLNSIVKRGEMDTGDIATVRVKIQFKSENNRQIIETIKEFKKTGEGEVTEFRPAESNVKVKGEGGMVKGTPSVIRKQIPEALYRYFFFGGEILSRYFRERGTSAENIREAIENIAQISKLEDVYEHTRSLKEEYRRNAGKKDSDVEKKRRKVERKEEKIEGCDEKISDFEEREKELKEKIEELDKKLRGVDAEEIEEKQKKRKNLEKEVDKLEDKLKSAKERKENYIIEHTPLVFSLDQLNETRELIRDKKDTGDIPPNFRKEFIENLLEDGECICGSSLSGDTEEEKERRKKLEEVYERTEEISNISEGLIDLKGNIRSILENISNFEERIEELTSEIEDREKQIKEKNETLKEISSFLSSVNEENVVNWNNRREKLSEKREDVLQEIGEYENEKTRLEKEKKEAEKELRKTEKGKKELEGILEKRDFCLEAEEALEEMKEEIVEEIRSEVEKNTEEQFLQYNWKERVFNGVKIAENYDVSALDRENNDATGVLSGGERKVLGLSFLSSLNVVSGFKVPLVIDSPLTDIEEGEPRLQIARILPEYLEERQVIFLVKRAEYTPDVREKFAGVEKEYVIKFKENTLGSKAWVEEYE
ncbi:hypothetical protein AKJ51_00255 [candidate division MSBL1 archaeon SCGC-AAA382A20]|uniref:Rad50/SbcC-type AAA domain-containing protein n=1 Tax=candidate division MSBL1 archaeon SCGC-AAA382A20 TaxID=1698280 RepID=A0A133VML9_9EURY|nr:hypothetical protein AKJ51_00255 [candidate division MSBL1 archaeon SCGC-AAA382A20]